MATQLSRKFAAAFFVPAILVAALSVHANAAQTPSPPGSDDDPHAQALEMVNTLNRINPFAQISPAPSGQPFETPRLSPELAEKLQYAQKLLDNPVTRKYIRVLSDPKVQQDIHVLINNPERTAFLAWEFAWIIVMFLFKAWRLTKSKRLISIIFTQLWTLCLFLGGVFYLVPRAVFGDDFTRLAHDLIQIFRNG